MSPLLGEPSQKAAAFSEESTFLSAAAVAAAFERLVVGVGWTACKELSAPAFDYFLACVRRPACESGSYGSSFALRAT
jgi:hypothetical protein